MANTNYVYQQTRNVSISKEKLLEIATNDDLTETDLRVLFCLFTELNGWVEPKNTRQIKDPLNFKIIDKDKIAKCLSIKKKEVKKSINHLMDNFLIEPGDSETVVNGYRFTF